MIFEVVIPKTGLNVEECQLIEWVADEGSAVEVGQLLFLMETEKVEVEVESDDAGYLHRIGIPGTDYPVGAVVGHIATTEDEYRGLIS